MQNILLQEIYSYNKNISLWNLINKRIIFKYWYAFIVPISFFILSSYFHFSQSSILAIVFYILSIIIIILLGIFLKRKQKQVILQKYKYVIDEKGNFKKNWGLKIQKKELEKLLGVNLGKEKLSFLIDNYEEFTKEIKYDYKITIFVVGLIGFLFKDFRPYLGKCYFNNCRHISEPKCAIRKAIEDGVVQKRRYESYLQIFQKLKYSKKY